MALLMKPEPFSREIDRVFDAFFGQTEQQARRWVPPMDLVEAEDHFVLKADLPGLQRGRREHRGAGWLAHDLRRAQGRA